MCRDLVERGYNQQEGLLASPIDAELSLSLLCLEDYLHGFIVHVKHYKQGLALFQV